MSTGVVESSVRGIRINNEDFYVYDYDAEKNQLIVSHSNVKRSVGKELFSCLSKRKDRAIETLSVMTKSQIAKATKA